VAEAANELGRLCLIQAQHARDIGNHDKNRDFLTRAGDYFLRFVDIHRDLDNLDKVATGLGLLGKVHEDEGDLDRALGGYEESLNLCQRYYPFGSAEMEQAIARVRAMMGRT
jgi:hypothetical protein